MSASKGFTRFFVLKVEESKKIKVRLYLWSNCANKTDWGTERHSKSTERPIQRDTQLRRLSTK